MKKLLLNNLVESVTKKILNEGVFDYLVLGLSRLIVDRFKSKKNINTTFNFNRGDDYANVQLTCEFIKDNDYNEPFSINAESDFDIIEMYITYNPRYFPYVMNDLVAEIKETLTHELEHVGQQNFEDMYINFGQTQRNYVDYLMADHEVPAYVKGLIKRSKTKNISLSDAMNEWYKENRRNFEDPNDFKKVKKTWMDYAKEMRSKQKVKKFK